MRDWLSKSLGCRETSSLGATKVNLQEIARIFEASLARVGGICGLEFTTFAAKTGGYWHRSVGIRE